MKHETEETNYWTHDRCGELTLRVDGKELYHIDLNDVKTSASLLDWIFQVASKEWATKEILGDLIRVLVIVIDPQRTLCSGGVERGSTR